MSKNQQTSEPIAIKYIKSKRKAVVVRDILDHGLAIAESLDRAPLYYYEKRGHHGEYHSYNDYPDFLKTRKELKEIGIDVNKLKLRVAAIQYSIHGYGGHTYLYDIREIDFNNQKTVKQLALI